MSASRRKPEIDYAKIDAHEITAEEYEEIPELTDAFFEKGEYFIGGAPVSRKEGEAAMAATLRPGRPRSDDPKKPVNIRLSSDVLEGFRATGKGWQTRIDEALRDWLKAHR